MRIRQKIESLLLIKERGRSLKKEMKRLLHLLNRSNLLTLDGCGILIASRLVGEIKDIKRFHGSAKLAKHSGLAPREFSSGGSKKHKSSNWGNRQMNKCFYRIALSQIGACKNKASLSYYEKKKREGKSKR